jgi:hypothetical protein
LMPTAACTMQSGQIGLPQSEQETAVSTRGWFAQYRGPVWYWEPAAAVTRASVASARCRNR